MKFMTLASTLFAAALAAASPVQNQARDVWTPKMTYPTAGTVWTSGQWEKVTWETADAPVNITGPDNGFIILRFGEIESPLVLAHNIHVRRGEAWVQVPSVYTGSDYSLVLFGDSGNWGPTFTINGPITF